MVEHVDVGLFKMALNAGYIDWIDAHKKAVGQGITRAIRRSTRGAQRELRRGIKRAGLGVGLEKAWRSEQYPKRGYSLKPAGFVYSKASKIHAQFDKGTEITINRKKLMAIPTKAVPKKGRGRMRPKDFNDLEFIPSRNRKSGVLVRKDGNGNQVVMFVLVKQVRGRKYYDLGKIENKWGAKIPNQAVRDIERAAKRLGLD